MFLKSIKPTPEQRKIFFIDPNRPVLLSGRAGSGKTTTAILRAAQLINFYQRQGLTNPRVGLFVFNNTLRTYLDSLASQFLSGVNYDVWVIDSWCKQFLHDSGFWSINNITNIANDSVCKDYIKLAIEQVGLSTRCPGLTRFGLDFLIEEVNYILGRFGLDTVKYIQSQREGRGTNPEIDDATKQAIAEELIPAYQLFLEEAGYMDLNQLRDNTLSWMKAGAQYDSYDILIVDEAQDLSALQIQILLKLVSSQTRAITFIRDTTQRIYKNHYIWNDVRLNFSNNSKLDLQKNYRNTREIAMVAQSLMSKANEDDIDILDPDLTETYGEKPVWVRGRYLHQQNYLLDKLSKINTSLESVGILHIRVEDVSNLASLVRQRGCNCCVLKDEDDLKSTSGGIYISTLHSAKGLEFDHVFIIGYDDFFAPGPKRLSHRTTSAHLSSHRKLLYTAITRARQTLTITSSINEYSPFLKEISTDLLDIISI